MQNERRIKLRKKETRMGADAVKEFIIDFFQAHAVKGILKPGRTYEVVETGSTQLKIRSRSRKGISVQTVFANLQTCKSLKYGEFRRVDLFWGMERKERNGQIKPDLSKSNGTGNDSFYGHIPDPEFTPSGDLVPVDTFMSRRIDPAQHSRKEESA